MSQQNERITERLRNAWKKFSEEYDIESFPMFLIFTIVVTLGMALNYIAMRPVVGSLPALLTSGIFEFGILAWKWGSNRKKNSDAQKQIVEVATWISVILAVLMIVINLFRAQIEDSISVEASAGVTLNGWETAAYIVIGIAALAHIVAYLMFDREDTDKEDARVNKRTEHLIRQRGLAADNEIKNVEADLKILERISVDIQKLRDKYIHLPQKQREILLENARLKLLEQYKASDLVAKMSAGLADENQDGKIADTPIEVSSLFTPKNKKWTLAELLQHSDFEMDTARSLLSLFGSSDLPEAFEACSRAKLIPADMTFENFQDLYNQLMRTEKVTDLVSADNAKHSSSFK